MKKVFVLIIALSLIALLASCSPHLSNTDGVTSPSSETTESITVPPADDSSEETIAPDDGETVTSSVGDDTITWDNDDKLALRYRAFSEIVSFTPGDGSAFSKRPNDLASATDAYFAEYGNDVASRPPLLYYLVHKMRLTESEVYGLFPTGSPAYTDSLFIADIEEAKRALMTEYSFYTDGKVYTFYEVYDAEMAGKPLFDITKSDHAATWWEIYDYLLYQKARDENGNPHSAYKEYLPYVEEILKENFKTITDIEDWEALGLQRKYSNAYTFLWNLLSGESEIPEYNRLGIKEYSLTRLYHSSAEKILEFTFTVTGNSLPETLPPGTYTKIVCDTINVFLHDGKAPETEEEYVEEKRAYRGMDKFGDIPAVQAVNAYLNIMPWNLAPYGEWDITEGILPSNYICQFYGNENMEIDFDEMQRLLLEKFGISIDKPAENHYFYRCKYNKDTDTVYYADTRGFESIYRIIDFEEVDGTSYVTVQLYADRLYLIPSHKVRYQIGEGDVFLGYEIIETGKYKPRELG